MVIGVLAVLLSFALPALGRAQERAKQTRMLATVRSDLAALTTYTQDNQGVFPCVGHDPSTVSIEWWKPVVAGGHLPTEASVDPEGVRLQGEVRIGMSMCFGIADADLMPGSVRPIDTVVPMLRRTTEVVFPSQKGALVQWLAAPAGHEIRFWAWNPYRSPSLPVAMLDGSTKNRKCTDFRIEPAYFEDWAGYPVISTWQGCRGMDMLR